MTDPDSSDGVTVCACKGIRTCLQCEQLKGKGQLESNEPKIVHRFIFDPETRLAVGRDCDVTSFPFPGVFYWEDFITDEEETELTAAMDQDVWNESQSGRRKQDFGPKVNFKKQKVRFAGFNGLPPLSQKLVQRMTQNPRLSDFTPVEQCNLDYHPNRGSAIDPHLDDSWLWGERLVTLNMLSNTTLTMSLEEGFEELGLTGEVRVEVGLPRRSLVVLYGEARHRWRHGIHREDVIDRRVCSTYRELSKEFMHGGEKADIGAKLLDIALSYTGTPI